MSTNDQDNRYALDELYENNYIKGNVITEAKEEMDSDDDKEEPVNKGFKKKGEKIVKKSGKKWGKTLSDDEKGQSYVGCDSVQHSFDNVFSKLLKEMAGDDEGDDFHFHDGDEGVDDNAFSPGGEEGFDDDEGEVSVPKREIRDIIEKLQSLLGEVEDEFSGGDEFEDEGEGADYGMDDDDEIPAESTNYDGDQGTYDGKAKRQGQSNLVKANGDMDKGKRLTHYAPSDTDGHEGEELGDQGTYDGKAKKQGQSDHVDANGNAKVKKSQKTGYKPNEPKKGLF